MRISNLSACLLLPRALASQVKADERPNVLFISVDDWNDWVGAYGIEHAKTPNLDRLAARGVAFRNAHTSAVYCAPSHTSIPRDGWLRSDPANREVDSALGT